MRHFTIDQSGKIEETNVDTILAFSSSEIQYSIKIPKQMKQNIFIQCQKKHKTTLVLRLFSYDLSLLLKGKVNKDSIISIDDEYPGHGKDIKQHLTQYLGLQEEQIKFTLIGKKDSAHRIAYQTFRGKLKPDQIVTEKEFNLEIIIPAKKIKELLK